MIKMTKRKRLIKSVAIVCDEDHNPPTYLEIEMVEDEPSKVKNTKKRDDCDGKKEKFEV